MLPRHLAPKLDRSLRHFPAVFLLGARQVGKSTLTQALIEQRHGTYRTLDDRTTLDAALYDPDGFVAGLQVPAAIDEVQRAPDLLRAIKLVIDRNRRPGMYLLTGSANILTLSTVAETLAGRTAVHELLPFSWAELKKKPAPAIVDTLFAARDVPDLMRRLGVSAVPDRRPEIKQRVLAGGYPDPALMRDDHVRRDWFEGYRRTYIERDVRDLGNPDHLVDFNRMLGTLALRTGQLINFSELSRDIGLPVTTVRRYFGLLLQTYQAFLLQPYFTNARKRLVKTPKVYLGDSGLACHLAATWDWQVLELQGRAGALLETWVASELQKLISLAAEPTRLWYFRTHANEEVDFLLERGERLVGIEVKLGTGFRTDDLRGLAGCEATLGKRLRLGVLAHTGTELAPIRERLIAMPLSMLLGRE